MEKKDLPIGFLDSGVGGLSVMREAIKIMPNENYIYFGDSKNAPYGVKERKGLVVACNTATSAAVSELRRVYPDMPLVGIEPAIKPAVELNKNGKILIMATPMTIKQEKFNLLLNKYKEKAEIVPIPCAGLMEFIENGVLSGKELEDYLEEKLSLYNKEEISSIVLGCTHYPFVKDAISKIMGNDVAIIDGGEGTAREIKRRLKEKDLLSDREETGNITIYNSLHDQKVIDLSLKLIQQL